MRHIIILLALLSVSCSSALPSFKPYRMDIQQGNVVTSKMMMQLRPGMTKSQVRFIMGTPLIQDSFHSNRWDYFYQMRQEGKIVEQRRVIMEFENDALARVRGDVIPAGSGQQDLATPATTPESLSKAGSAKAKKEEKGLVDKLKFWKSDEEEKKADEKPSALTAPVAADALAPAPTPSSAPAGPSAAEPAQGSLQEPASATPAVSSPAPVSDSAPQEALPAAEPTPDSVTVEPIISPEPLAAPVAVPAESQPTSDSSASSGEPSKEEVQLMLDRSIDLPTDTGNPSNVSNPSHAPDADLPSEASPDFFERMLEKIGF